MQNVYAQLNLIRCNYFENAFYINNERKSEIPSVLGVLFFINNPRSLCDAFGDRDKR